MMSKDTKAPAQSMALSTFNFHGDELDVLQDGERVWVSVRRVCEALGVSYQGQIVKLKDDPAIGVRMILTPSEGGPQETACIELEGLPLWLATIHPNKVKFAVREKLVQYKREAAKVLADHFLGRRHADMSDANKTAAISAALLQRVIMLIDRHEERETALLNRIEALEARPVGMLLDCAGVGGATFIKGQLKKYGFLMAVSGETRERARCRSRGEMELRGALSFVGTGRRWEALPSADYAKARLKLAEMIRMAEQNAVARGAPGGVVQDELFAKKH